MLGGSTVEKQYFNNIFCDMLFKESQHLLLFGQRINNLRGRLAKKKKRGLKQRRYLINENGIPEDICQINGMTKEMRMVVCEEGNV